MTTLVIKMLIKVTFKGNTEGSKWNIFTQGICFTNDNAS
jgi:hypothetical protein